MKKTARNNRRNKYFTAAKRLWWQFLIPMLYFVLMYLYFPFRNVFWMDHDEGINVGKAMMMLKGFHLYSDIWSDQPPFFTYLLTDVLRIKYSINTTRLLVLLIACGLFFLLIHYLYKTRGAWHALAGVVLVVLLPRFTDLSVSVMIGLPAIAFAVASLVALVYWHKTHRYLWLVLSALALCMSVLTKIFTGFLAPIFLVGILIDSYTRQRALHMWRQILLPGLIWGVILTAVIITPILLTVGLENLPQLIGTHINSSSIELFQDEQEYGLLPNLVASRMILMLAVLGIAHAVIRKHWLSLYPTAWMVAAFALLYNHKPVWSHQQLLITIPAVILAAGATGDALYQLADLLRRKVRPNSWVALYLVSLVVFTLIIVERLPLTASQFNSTPAFRTPPFRETSAEVSALKQILLYADETDWFLTDLPMFAFYADLPVPPNLVVFSSKRVLTDNLTEAEILQTLIDYQPEQVFFGRNEFPAVQVYLEEHYQLIYAREPMKLYLIDEIEAVDKDRT